MAISSDAFEKKAWLLDEVTYGVFPDGLTTAISANDSLDVISIVDTITREQNPDMRLNGSRSELVRTEGRKIASLSIKKNMFPSGTATTTPTEHKLLNIGIGTNTISGDILYSQIAKRSKSLSLYYEQGHFSEYFTGLVPSELVFEFSGSGEDMLTINCPFADKFANGTTSLAATVADSATIFTITVADMAQVNSRMEIESEIVLVTAIDTTGLILTVTRAYQNTSAAAHSAGVTIGPVTPTHTIAGFKLEGIKGSFSIDTTPFDFIDGSIRLNNATTLFNDEAGTSIATGYTDGLRVEVAGTFNIRLYKDKFFLIPKIEKFKDIALALTRGDTVGQRFQFLMAKVKGISKEILKNETEAVFQMDFVALGTAGEDNLTLKHF